MRITLKKPSHYVALRDLIAYAYRSNYYYTNKFEFMSTLHHADLLESIYEGLLYELQEAGHDITNPNAQYVAEVRAEQIFEEMCQ